MDCPLQFPRQWPDIRRRSLLLGFPFIGPQVGAYADLCGQLALRTAECWSLWGPDEARLRAAQFVATSVAKVVDWPNPIFIPDDPFELIFWDHRVLDDLVLMEAFVEIELHFDKSLTLEESTRLAEGTLGGYVDFLLSARKSADRVSRPP